MAFAYAADATRRFILEKSTLRKGTQMAYGLQPTKIEWCHIPNYRGTSWNPLGWGCSYRGCVDANGVNYCYAQTIARRFGDNVCKQYPTPEQVEQHCLDPKHSLCWNFFPHIHRERLDAPLRAKKKSAIFVQSMGDLWDPNVPQEWRDAVFEIIEQCPQHIFFLLTKQALAIRKTTIPCGKNIFLGVTIEQSNYEREHNIIYRGFDRNIFVSYEPLLGPIDMIPDIDWVIIGQDSRPGQPRPQVEWVQNIIEQAQAIGIPVFIKPPLVDWWVAEGHGDRLQQWLEIREG